MPNFEFNLNANERKRFSLGIICRQFLYGDKCPNCEEAKRLYLMADRSNSKAEAERIRELAKQYYARSKVFVNAINCKDEDSSFPLRIYALPPTIYDDLLSLLKSMKAIGENPQIFHPTTGRNVVITRKGQKPQIRYTVNIDSKVSPIPNQEIRNKLLKGELDCLYNLNELPQMIENFSVPISVIDTDITILRIMPPFDGRLLYKEIKFHRDPGWIKQTISEIPEGDLAAPDTAKFSDQVTGLESVPQNVDSDKTSPANWNLDNSVDQGLGASLDLDAILAQFNAK